MGVGDVSWCRVRGPLASWAAGYERWLAARGYARWSVRNRVCQLAQLRITAFVLARVSGADGPHGCLSETGTLNETSAPG